MQGLPAYVDFLNYLFIVLYMFSVPLETGPRAIIDTLKSTNLMGRALLANFIVIPVLGILLAVALSLPPDIKIGFLLLALTPGGLLALQFARVSNGNRVFAVALLFLFCLLSILFVPFVVHLLFAAEKAGEVPLGRLVVQLLLLVVVPALIGRWVQTILPGHAPKLGLWLGRLSIVIFILATVLGGSYRTGAIKLIGREAIAGMVLLIVGCWIVGWLLGGPEVRDRKVLAISSSMRNVGICLAVASGYFSRSDVALPVLAFSGFMIPMNMAFALILGRMFRDRREITAAAKA